jgi:hypothetical protein
VFVADEIRKERQKETKNDTAIELAALLHEVRAVHQHWNTLLSPYAFPCKMFEHAEIPLRSYLR